MKLGHKAKKCGVIVIIIMGMACLVAGIWKFSNRENAEVVKNQITIPSYDAGILTYGEVCRGDIERLESVTMHMQSLEEMELFFGVSGLAIEKIYVAEGDYVEKGQLLGELSCKDIKNELSALQLEREKLEKNLAYNKECLEAAQGKKGDTEKEQKINQDEVSRYVLAIQSLEDEIVALDAKYGEKQAILAKRQIYANMSGVVSSVMKYGEGTLSDEKQAAFVLEGADKIFSGEMTVENSFAEGDAVELVLGEETYEATVVAVAKEGETTTISVSMNDMSADLGEYKQGKLPYSSGTLEDVLYVPSDAIITAGGKQYIQVVDEQNGFFHPVEVVTKEGNGNLTCIVSGVEEGTKILLNE